MAGGRNASGFRNHCARSRVGLALTRRSVAPVFYSTIQPIAANKMDASVDIQTYVSMSACPSFMRSAFASASIIS
jgi:hypothetical protein